VRKWKVFDRDTGERLLVTLTDTGTLEVVRQVKGVPSGTLWWRPFIAEELPEEET
jgi:hypothetical protein